MKITAAHRKTINTAARRVAGWLDHCEVAIRHCQAGPADPPRRIFRGPCPEHERVEPYNLALLGEHRKATDLVDLTRLADLREVEDAPNGVVILDVYVYRRNSIGGDDYELHTNLCVVFADGVITDITED